MTLSPRLKRVLWNFLPLWILLALSIVALTMAVLTR